MPQANASLAEEQRRIHELEMRAEQAQHAEQVAVPAEAPPAPAMHEEKPPVREERAASRVEQPRVEQPRVDPKEMLESAGLVMIETDRSKAAQVQAPVAEEAQPVGRPRRERAKPSAQDAELEQIETRK